jgi:hypothetical protein
MVTKGENVKGYEDDVQEGDREGKEDVRRIEVSKHPFTWGSAPSVSEAPVSAAAHSG